MLIDLEQAEGPLLLSGDVCVIGAGVAGITTARRLLACGHEVILLEAGGLDYERQTARINAGANIGRDYYPLEDARLRFFGGTTAIWGGRVATLSPIDLERRDWVPHSGWPIGWGELDAYYRRAMPLFGLSPESAGIGDLAAAGLAVPAFDPDRVTMPVWLFDQAFDRFSFAASGDVVNHPRCTIVTHANVTDIALAGDARSVRAVTAKSLSGRRVTVRPRQIVLAAGGIENARLLLASRSTMPCGIGNGHDQVGRYFMEHPHARGGRIVSGHAWSLLKLFGRRHTVGAREMAALITPGEALQRREGILNTSLTLVARQPESAQQFIGMKVYGGLKHKVAPTRAGRRLWMGTKMLAAWAQQRIDPARPWLLHKLGQVELTLLVRAEQAPNPESRVRLGETRDALGMPRATLDWRLSDIDKRSVQVLVETLGAELRRLDLGTVEAAPWLADPDEPWRTDPLVSSHPIGGFHHIGTTRMADDPRRGVVDGYGRVHGVANLNVVGSSTFPTGGWANPTLTIAALALRTADRLSAELERRPVDVRVRECA
jgi:choline dehydrogenase-like flavoprotein